MFKDIKKDNMKQQENVARGNTENTKPPINNRTMQT